MRELGGCLGIIGKMYAEWRFQRQTDALWQESLARARKGEFVGNDDRYDALHVASFGRNGNSNDFSEPRPSGGGHGVCPDHLVRK